MRPFSSLLHWSAVLLIGCLFALVVWAYWLLDWACGLLDWACGLIAKYGCRKNTVGIREDLTDFLTILEPEDTPKLSLFAKSPRPTSFYQIIGKTPQTCRHKTRPSRPC